MGQTWRRACGEVGRLREPRRLNAWLYGLARRSASERVPALTRLNGRREPAPAPPDSGDCGPEVWADPERVHRSLDSLPLAEREVLTLVLLEDFSPADLSTILGIAPDTAGARLRQAWTALRETLNGKEAEDERAE